MLVASIGEHRADVRCVENAGGFAVEFDNEILGYLGDLSKVIDDDARGIALQRTLESVLEIIGYAVENDDRWSSDS